MFTSLCIIWPFFTAIANRIRGGWFGYEIKKFIPIWGTTVARIYVSIIISFPIILTYPKKDSLIFLILLYIGFIWAWSPWVSMSDPKKDTLELTLRGFILTFPPGAFLHLWLFAFCGLLMGLCYLVGLYFPIKHQESDGLIWGATESGELYFGAILGMFISISLFF